MGILGFLGGTADPQRGLGFKEASEGAHLEELTFPPPPVCARPEQRFSMHGGIMCGRLACFSLEEE